MTFRKRLKYGLYSIFGSFPYFGVRVYFPRGSRSFRATCEQGIFEAGNVRVLQDLCREGSYLFDVGAHLGLMAIPLLATVRGVCVISYEPSPNALPWLKETVREARLGERWQLVEKAVGAASSVSHFSISDVADGLFDGLRHTLRVPQKDQVPVDVTTLDDEWRRLGFPSVSMIKIDVEGAELGVLRGARNCLEKCRPFVLLEWNRTNLAAYGVTSGELLEFAHASTYGLYSVPSMIRIRTAAELRLQQSVGESFLLAPEEA
jgi:FkbM family methyltransferase